MALRERVKALYGGSLPWAVDDTDRVYGLPACYLVGDDFAAELRRAAERIAAVFQRLKDYFYAPGKEEELEALLAILSVDRRLWDFVRLRGSAYFSPIARFDFTYDPEAKEFKMLEVNADTPCLFLEAFKATARFKERYGARWRHDGLACSRGTEAEIGAAFARIFFSHIANGWKSAANIIVFSACDECQEDRETAIYLREVAERFLTSAGNFRCIYTPLTELMVGEGALYADCGGEIVRVDMLYRLYPLEFLIEDKDENGGETGKAVLALYRDKRLILANPPDAFLFQTKRLQSFLYDLALRGAAVVRGGDCFGMELFRHFLPAADTVEELVKPAGTGGQMAAEAKIVAKPALGREGCGIEIFSRAEYERDREAFAGRLAANTYVYQQFSPTLKKKVDCLQGREFDVIFSCFLLEGKASAIACRLSEGVTTQNNCYFVPIIEVPSTMVENEGEIRDVE